MSALNTPLQHKLAARIVEMVHEDGLPVGTRIKESVLAERLNVSRTPVRAALQQLADQGVVRHEPNRGMILAAVPPRPKAPDTPAGNEDLLIAIARFRRNGVLGNEFTEAELMRLTNADRPEVKDALIRLEGLNILRRKTGYGWEFIVGLRDAQARAESYRFRILIECGAIMEPGYALDPAWIASMREQHRRFIETKWNDSSSVALFEMNAVFHEGVAAGSGNRYLIEAMRQQNQLRRLHNYNWNHGPERVMVTCSEHLEILDRLEEGANEIAAALMRRHLQGANLAKAV